MLRRDEQTDKSWRLHGLALQAALFVGAAFSAGALLASVVDLYAHAGSDSPTLQTWTLVPQIFACSGLMFMGYRRGSVAFYGLAVLIGLIVIEEAFHVLNPVAAWLGRISSWVLVYALVALVGFAGLTLSHRYGSRSERRVVRNVGALLLVAGFFGGPIAVVSTAVRPTPGWYFIEEFGEALVFAVIGGYVAGLVALVGAGSRHQPFRPTRP